MSRSITSSDANGATFETVGSSGGFSAGDLVYYSSTGYNRIPASAAPSTATSAVTKPYPTLPTTGTSGGYFQSSDFPALGYSRALATLSNGNAVAVYGNIVDGYPYFVVFNPTTRAIVTGPTVISTTFSMTPGNNTGGLNIGVAAFAGGNFVVYWGNNAGGTASRVNYATYTNAGAAVVAVTQDATLAVNNVQTGHMRGVTLPNGGFVLAFGNSNNVYFRAYDAAGVGQFAWVTLPGTPSNAGSSINPSWGMTARSDNTYLISGQSTTAGTYQYAIYNYTGTAVVANTTFLVTGGTTNGTLDCTTLSDGTTFVIAYAGQTTTNQQGWSFRFLPTGNVLSSPFFIQGNFNGTAAAGAATANYVRVWPLSSGRFLITGVDSSSVGAYAVFNSSGTPLLGTTGSLGTASSTRSFGSYFLVNTPVLGVIESGGNAEVYTHARISANYPSPPYFRIDLTTYNMVSASVNSAALSVPLSLTPASGYAPSASTPSKAAFALSNGVYPYAQRVSSTSAVVAAGVYPTISQAITAAVGSYDMCVLSTGNICVVAAAFTGGAVSAYIYNPITLALIGSLEITNSGPAAAVTGNLTTPTVRVTPLDGGNFCVAAGTALTNLRLTVWNSSFVQQGSTVNITTVSQSYGSQPQAFAIATISGNRVVVVYQTVSTSATYAVYSSTLTLTSGPTVVISSAGAIQCNSICATPDGFMVATGDSTGNAYKVFIFYEFSANVFTQPSVATYTAYSGPFAMQTTTFLMTNNTGQAYVSVQFDSTNYRTYNLNGSASALIIDQATGSPGATGVTTGITAAGTPFMVYQDSASFVTGAAVPGLTAVTSLTGWVAPTVRFGSQQLRSVPLYGNMVLVAYLIDTGNRLAFGTLQVNGYPDSAVFTTADLTATSPIYPQPTTTTTPAVVGQTLAGVAVTDCAAGGTGVIQTTGATNLNSNYPTTTAQTFDYTGQAAPGIKGTISGRAISMRKS